MAESSSRPALRALARAAGIQEVFTDASGVARSAGDDVLVAVLAALGLDAATEAAAAAAGAELPPSPAAARSAAGGEPPAGVRCMQPAGRGGGLLANLYSVRSRRNLGVGDLGDLRALIDLAAARGDRFVGFNPLHALRNTRSERSPYGPISRLFPNPLYIDPEAVPEWAEAEEPRRSAGAAAFRSRAEALRAADELDYAAVAALKRELFEPLHRTFARLHRDRDGDRGRAYRAYVEEQGPALQDHATFLALDERFGAVAGGRRARPWKRWPLEYRDPRSAAVAAFRAEHFEVFDLHRWLAFECDRQIGAAARHARARGLDFGLFPDLAVGSLENGSDAWARQDLFVTGASLGAPPDGFAPDGQVWMLPPLHPVRLEREEGSWFRTLLRAQMRHAGMLRVDHVIGLVRQYWIPKGFAGSDGVMVRFPAELLFRVLAEESRRAGVVVVGEDLGTVPAELPPLMERHGVLSTRVVRWEWVEGRLRAAGEYPHDALVTAGTHDHVPLAGWISGADLPIHRRLGRLRDDAALEEARANRRAEVAALRDRLIAEGLLASGAPPDAPALVAAVHAFLARTAAVLHAVALDDLALEESPVNVPGETGRRYPCWARRMRRSIEEIRGSPPGRE